MESTKDLFSSFSWRALNDPIFLKSSVKGPLFRNDVVMLPHYRIPNIGLFMYVETLKNIFSPFS